MTTATDRMGTFSADFSIGTALQNIIGLGITTSAWPTTDKAFFVPLRVPNAKTLTGFWWVNGATLTDSADCGLFDTAGTMLISTGSTARAGASLRQSVTVANTAVAAGLYYVGFALHGTSGTMARIVPANVGVTRGLGVLQQTSLFPLATATFAQVSASYIPLIGVEFG